MSLDGRLPIDSRGVAMFSRSVPCVVLVLAAGCSDADVIGKREVNLAREAALDDDSGFPGAAPLPGTKILAGGSLTCDFGLLEGAPLVAVPPATERDRMYMAERPGMQTKQLPIGLDLATGQLYSGGRYLFDEAAQAADY